MFPWPSVQTDRDVITAIVVSIPDEIIQRKGAKNAKLFKTTRKNRDFSCDGPGSAFFVNYLRELCLFAVNPLFTDQTV
jgi:hypothetical protein